MSTSFLDSGYAALRRGDHARALNSFQCAINQHSDHPQTYFAAAEQGKTEEAMRNFRDTLSGDPTYTSAHAYLDILLLQLYDGNGVQQA